MKHQQRKRKGIKRTWLLSYFSVLAVPLLITGMLFLGVEKIVSDKISSMNESILHQIKGTLDNMFDSVYKSSLQMELSSEVNNVLPIGRVPENSDYFQIHRLNESIRQYTTYSDYVDDMIVYLDKSGYSISSKSSYGPELFDEMLRQYKFTQEDWHYLNGIKKRGFYILNQDGGNGGRLIYMAPLPSGVNAEKSGKILIIPKEKYVNQKLNNEAAGVSKAVYLADEEHIMPLGMLPSWMNGEFAEAFQEMENQKGEIDRKSMIYSSLKSEVADLKYVIVDRYGTVYKELQMIRGLVLSSIAGSMILGIWFAFYFTKKNYTPMKELITSVMGHAEVAKEHDANEYIFLSNAMTRVIHNKEAAEKQLSLIRLLRGHVIAKTEMGRRFPSGVYAAAAFAIEDTRDFFTDEELVPDRHRLLAFVVSNCAKDFFPQAAELFDVVELDRYLIQIICYEDTRCGCEALLREEILKTLEEMQHFFNETLKIGLSISLGELCHGPEELAKSYERAREALEYRVVMGNNVVIDSHGLTNFSLFYDYSLEAEKDIINSLKNGNYEQSRDSVFRVIDSNLASGMMSSQLARCMLFDLVGTVIKALSMTRLDNNFLGQLNPIERLFQCETFEQMKTELSILLSQVCDYIKKDDADPNKKLFASITGYVEHHYMDVNLNVSTLAAALFVSKTFLVKLFKEHLGITPLDYINRLRCEKAVILLGRPEYTVEEIAEKTGYASVHSFIRVFKKLYGKTPGAYRMMLLREEWEE